MALSSATSFRSLAALRSASALVSALVSALALVVVPIAAAPASAQPETTLAQATETTLAQATETTLAQTTSTAIDPDNPLSHEEPGEEAPASDITVPPKDTYEGQEPYEPPAILWSSVAQAKRKLADSEQAKRDAIVEVRALRRRHKELAAARGAIGAETAAAIDELDEASRRLETRAVIGYRRFGSGSDEDSPSDLADHGNVVDAQRRSKMVDSALDVDEADIDRLEELRTTLDVDALALLQRLQLVSDYLVEAEEGIVELDEAIDQATIEYEAFLAGSEIFIHGVRFPIGGTYSVPLIDSFGFPRMPGTPDEHWHEGIDIFAPRGTPLVATERGVITKVGNGRLGGLKFWLAGESGTEWYYAHLDSFAPGLVDGAVVEAGDLLGYVGNTGNAVGTPPHLHLQMHPDGGRPVNPYPLLKVVSDLDRSATAAGTHPGFDHQPVTVAVPIEPADPVAEIAGEAAQPAGGTSG